MSFVRLQAVELSDALGIHIGVFGLVNMLFNRGLLSRSEMATRRRQLDWFNDRLPDPMNTDPSVYEVTTFPGAVSWFKHESSAHLIAGMSELCKILDAHDVAWQRVEALRLQRVIYEDTFQAVAVRA